VPHAGILDAALTQWQGLKLATVASLVVVCVCNQQHSTMITKIQLGLLMSTMLLGFCVCVLVAENNGTGRRTNNDKVINQPGALVALAELYDAGKITKAEITQDGVRRVKLVLKPDTVDANGQTNTTCIEVTIEQLARFILKVSVQAMQH
jgi:hypothetical protein